MFLFVHGVHEFSQIGVALEKILMARRPLDKIHEHHALEMHFLHASRAWRQNKREVFSEAGSSGSFE